jgi:P27 family predicted phage terminase small subunit
MPVVPRGLLARSRQIWERFWGSELSAHVDRAADIYRVERWIRDVDELERAWRLFRRERFVTGSMGQIRLNTVWKVVQDCESRVAKSEEQLGMTPLARARLGLTLGQAANTLDELNRRMNEPDEPKGPRVVAGRTIDGEWSPL